MIYIQLCGVTLAKSKKIEYNTNKKWEIFNEIVL